MNPLCAHVPVLHTVIYFRSDGFTNMKKLLLSEQRLDKSGYHKQHAYYFLNLLSIYECFRLSAILEHHLHTSTWFGFVICKSNTTHLYFISNIYLQAWNQVLLGDGKIASTETSSIRAKITQSVHIMTTIPTSILKYCGTRTRYPTKAILTWPAKWWKASIPSNYLEKNS